jgi:hypothetical protein
MVLCLKIIILKNLMEIDSENKENIENMLNKYYEDFLSLIK